MLGSELGFSMASVARRWGEYPKELEIILNPQTWRIRKES